MPHSPEQGPRSPETLKPKEWREVVRTHEVVVIGDLHGRHEALVANGTFSNIIEKRPNNTLIWKGGDKRVVLLGDILADRFLDGPQILADIYHLNIEAEKAGGQIILLTGNHDIWGFSYLFHEGFDEVNEKEHVGRAIPPFGRGLFAFLALAGIPFPNDFSSYSQNEIMNLTKQTLARDEVRQAIRHRIAQSSELQAHYAQYRIMHRIDDTLFTHCDPTPEMIENLLQVTHESKDIDEAIQKINTTFQENVMRCLKDPEAKPNNDYRDIVATYAKTKNRTSFSSSQHIDQLRKLGINAAIHGHTAPGETTHGDLAAHTFTRQFLILSVDRQALANNALSERRSVAIIKKNGEIVSGEQAKPYRTRKGFTFPQFQHT